MRLINDKGTIQKPWVKTFCWVQRLGWGTWFAPTGTRETILLLQIFVRIFCKKSFVYKAGEPCWLSKICKNPLPRPCSLQTCNFQNCLSSEDECTVTRTWQGFCSFCCFLARPNFTIDKLFVNRATMASECKLTSSSKMLFTLDSQFPLRFD